VNCDEVRAALLAGDRSAAVEAHRRGCAACRRAEPGLEMMRRHLHDADLWVEPSPELQDRVVAAVRTAATGTGTARAPDAGVETADARRPGRRWSLSSGVAVAAMGAAFAAVVAVIAVVVAGSGSEHPDFQFALVGTRAAPAASATVYGWNEAAGTRLELDVEGLPPSGPDAYYTVWMTSPDGRHVPAGTFRSSGTVWVWSGVTEIEFPRVWVTLEPNDHDESLSGPAVLDTVVS
jgi:hypothetical protein